MSRRSHRNRNRVVWPWKIGAFALAATLIVALEQLAQVWLLPGDSAALALEQLHASDSFAESLRLHEYWRRSLWALAVALISSLAIALFVPFPQAWNRWLRHHLR